MSCARQAHANALPLERAMSVAPTPPRSNMPVVTFGGSTVKADGSVVVRPPRRSPRLRESQPMMAANEASFERSVVPDLFVGCKER